MYKKYLFILTTILLLNSCDFSQIDYKKDNLIFELEKISVLLNAKEVKKEASNFSSLLVLRRTLKLNDGNLVVYENDITDIEYEFSDSLRLGDIFNITFKAKSSILVFSKNSLLAYQIILNNGKVLNILAQYSDSQNLRFVYGLSNQQLNDIIKKLEANSINLNLYKNPVVISDQNKMIYSKWTMKEVHFYPLVVPISKLLGQ